MDIKIEVCKANIIDLVEDNFNEIFSLISYHDMKNFGKVNKVIMNLVNEYIYLNRKIDFCRIQYSNIVKADRVKHLFNVELINSIEKFHNLITLVLNNFNYEIDLDELPPNLTSLSMGDSFDRELIPGSLPSGLINLDLGFSFNKKISPGVLPKKLYKLKFGRTYDKPIEQNVLPASLRKLKFGEWFNQKIESNVLPEKLQIIKIHYDYSHVIDEIISNFTYVQYYY